MYVATPLHDTFVWQSNPNTNYSISSALYYKPAANEIITYIHPGIPANIAQNINSARIVVNFYSTPTAFNLNQTWPVDASTTWNNRPPSLGLIGVFTPTLGWNSFDVTDTVRQGRGVMLVARNVPGPQTFLYSREHTNAIRVEYSLHPTATPTPSATPTVTPTPSATATPSPTATALPSAQRLILPSGGIAEATAVVTYGDIITSGLLVFLIAIGLWVLAYTAAQRGGLRR
jgi:hypothetical protein